MEIVINQREVEKINPDDLFTIEYRDQDTLPDLNDQRVRRVNLDKAVTLGKSLKLKTSLVIDSKKGYKQLAVIVHAIGDQGISIERDHFVPMHAIYSVDMA